MRKGMLLPLVFLIMGILFLFAYNRLYVARENLNQTRHLGNREILYQIAYSQLKLVVSEFTEFIEAFNTGSSKMQTENRWDPFRVALLNSDGFLNFNNGEIPYGIPIINAPIATLNKEILVSAKIIIRGVKNLYEESSPVEGGDNLEKKFYLTIESTANFENLSLTSKASTEVKFISTLLPVLPKFSLFIQSLGRFKPNRILDTEINGEVKGRPILMNNGDSLSNFIPLKEVEIKKFISEQGYIYLGDGPWNLGLNHSGSENSVQSGGLPTSRFLYRIEGVPAETNNSLKFYSRARGMFKESSLAVAGEFLKKALPEDREFSSLINLFGSSLKPSPTVIIGKVFRKYILEQGLFNSTTGSFAPLPFVQKLGEFTSKTWFPSASPEVMDFLYRDVFTGDYENYKLRMSTPIEENYNLGQLKYLKVGEPETENLFFKTPTPTAIELDNITAHGSPYRLGNLVLDKNLLLKDEKNSTLFQGDPTQFPFKEILEKKMTFIHKNQSTFFKNRRVNGTIEVKGVEKIKGGLTLGGGSRFALNRPAMLICEGDLNLTGEIIATGKPLTLVSLKGDIFIRTDKPIRASLVSLEGGIQFPDKFEIIGPVSLKELGENGVKVGPGLKKISYDKQFDISKSENRLKSFQVIWREPWSFYQP